MPEDGDSRYNPTTKAWEQFHDPPGTWESVKPDFGELDRPVDDIGFDASGADAVAE